MTYERCSWPVCDCSKIPLMCKSVNPHYRKEQVSVVVLSHTSRLPTKECSDEKKT